VLSAAKSGKPLAPLPADAPNAPQRPSDSFWPSFWSRLHESTYPLPRAGHLLAYRSAPVQHICLDIAAVHRAHLSPFSTLRSTTSCTIASRRLPLHLYSSRALAHSNTCPYGFITTGRRYRLCAHQSEADTQTLPFPNPSLHCKLYSPYAITQNVATSGP
jgi:hypothetical protein